MTTPPIRLYRAHPSGRFGAPREFWATHPDYPRYVHRGAVPYATADLAPGARVRRFTGGSPTEAALEALDGTCDVAAWPCWDFEGEEYVVFNPAVLRNLTVTPPATAHAPPPRPTARPAAPPAPARRPRRR